MIDYFQFDFIITPYVIAIVYLLGVVAIFVATFWSTHYLRVKKKWSLTRTLLLSILLLITTQLIWRVMNEFIMVYFKIYTTLLGA
jgi:predicted tellurium resistance membrane protein TerC